MLFVEVMTVRIARMAAVACISVLLMATVVVAQRVYAIGGGDSTAPDPRDKGQIVMIAENERVRVTIGASKYKQAIAGMFSVEIKIENLTDTVFAIDPTTFNAIDDKGEAYASVDADLVYDRVLAKYGSFHDMFANAIAGPLVGPQMVRRTEQQGRAEMQRTVLSTSSIPPHAFKHGVVFFDAPKNKPYTVKIIIGELSKATFTFSTIKPRKDKTHSTLIPKGRNNVYALHRY